MVITMPYANSFTPPASAKLDAPPNKIMNQKYDDSDWYFPAPYGHKSQYVPPGAKNITTGEVEGADKVGVWEMKWEVDSLANFLGLAPLLAKHSGRSDFLTNPTWKRAVRLALDTLVAQQRASEDDRAAFEAEYTTPLSKRDTDWEQRFASRGGGVYRFQRDQFRTPTEGRSGKSSCVRTLPSILYSRQITTIDMGFGEPAAYTGMVKSAFRPSDDATILPFLVPSNAMLACSLSNMIDLIKNSTITDEGKPTSLANITIIATKLNTDIRDAIAKHVPVSRFSVNGTVYAYEVDGYGNIHHVS